MTDQQIDAITRQQIIPREFDADAVVDTVQMLLSPLSHAVSGQVIRVGGA